MAELQLGSADIKSVLTVGAIVLFVNKGLWLANSLEFGLTRSGRLAHQLALRAGLPSAAARFTLTQKGLEFVSSRWECATRVHDAVSVVEALANRIDGGRPGRLGQVARRLKQTGAISLDLANRMQSLYDRRNQVAHGVAEIDPREARAIVNEATLVIEQLLPLATLPEAVTYWGWVRAWRPVFARE